MANNNQLWRNQLQDILQHIRRVAKADLPRAIKDAETFLRWLGRYNAPDKALEQKRIATQRLLSDLVKVLKLKLAKRTPLPRP